MVGLDIEQVAKAAAHDEFAGGELREPFSAWRAAA